MGYMDKLQKSKNIDDMNKLIKKHQIKIQQYQTQIDKNNSVILGKLEKGENLLKSADITNPEEKEKLNKEKKELIKQIERSIEYNQKFKDAKKKNEKELNLLERSLEEAYDLYNTLPVPKHKPIITKTKRGGRYKKY